MAIPSASVIPKIFFNFIVFSSFSLHKLFFLYWPFGLMKNPIAKRKCTINILAYFITSNPLYDLQNFPIKFLHIHSPPVLVVLPYILIWHT